jgi:hypothetical protein
MSSTALISPVLLVMVIKVEFGTREDILLHGGLKLRRQPGGRAAYLSDCAKQQVVYLADTRRRNLS